MSSGALKLERSGSGARPTRTARSTSAVVPSCPEDAEHRATHQTWALRRYRAPHIRQLLAAGGLPCPDGQSAANIKDSVEEPSGGGMLGTGVEEVKVGGVSTSGETGGGIAA